MALGAIGLLGCNVDPGGGTAFMAQHCSELQGDATCQSSFAGQSYCSLCTEENGGCVSSPPAQVCIPGGTAGDESTDDGSVEDAESGSSSTGGTTDAVDTTAADSSSGGEPSCEAEGELDPACMELDPSRPFCADSACVGCEGAGGSAFCGELDPLNPACNVETGACVPCDAIVEPSCAGATPVCGDSGTCQACVAHDECPQSACHLDANDPLQGYCFEPTEVVWIDNMAECPGLGTQKEPLCSFEAAADALVPGDVRTFRVRGGAVYAERGAFSEVTIAIIGTDSPVLSGTPGAQAPTLRFENGTIAYVSDIRANGNTLSHGVTCSDAFLRYDDGQIRDSEGWGVFNFDPCTIELRRTAIVGNEDGGVSVEGGQLTIDNTTIALNGIGGNSSGVRVVDGNIDILYSTLAGNDGSGSDSIECEGATGTLRNNIIMGVDEPSIELACFPLIMENNALDADNFAAGTNIDIGPYDGILFNNPSQADFRLSAPPLSPFGGVAEWQEGDPEFDADGTPRPTGKDETGYAGVDEP